MSAPGAFIGGIITDIRLAHVIVIVAVVPGQKLCLTSVLHDTLIDGIHDGAVLSFLIAMRRSLLHTVCCRVWIRIPDALVTKVVPMLVSRAQARLALRRFIAILIDQLFLGANELIVMLLVFFAGVLAKFIFSTPKRLAILGNKTFLRIK